MRNGMPQQYKFLLVDDSLLDLFIHKKLISLSGLAESITTFNNAEEALQFLEEQGAALENSIMLLDLQMPGMNGFGFIDEFGKLPESVRVKLRIFILSSTVDEVDIKKARESQFVEEILPKPVDVTKLQIKLAKVDTPNP